MTKFPNITSKHLYQLREAGLIEGNKRKTLVEYSLTATCVPDLAACAGKIIIEIIEVTEKYSMSELDHLQYFPLYHTVDSLLHEIKEVFSSYFDHPWLINIIDELPESMGNMGSIRTFLALSSTHPFQESIIINGINSLKTMIRIINIWLIPESTDIFGVSPFTKKKALSDRTFRKCIAYTLPSNTTNLAMLIEEFEKEIIRESLIIN